MPTGEVVERSVAHSKGILHRTAHVWIIRKVEGRWQVLLQKRSENKDSYPGMFDTSSAGHIPAGVEPPESALRELSEELGIFADQLVLQESEVEAVQYFDLEEAYKETCEGSERFCMNPKGMKVLVDYLKEVP